MSDQSHKTIIVLGWNRSGTTMAAAILHSIGVQMLKPGQEEAASASHLNPRGHFEHSDFQYVMEHMRRGEAVDPVPYIEQNNRQFDLWGWKHPDTHIHFEKLLPLVDRGVIRNPHLVYVIRNPLEVAYSLMEWHHRDKDKEAQDHRSRSHLCKVWREAERNSFRLWEWYNRLTGWPSLLVTHHELSNKPLVQARRMAKWLGLELDNSAWGEAESAIGRRVIPGYSSWKREDDDE